MLWRASVQDLKGSHVSRREAYIAIVMRFYPRFVRKGLCHEYIAQLAPPAELFAEFKCQARKLRDHNRAFDEVDYESRFEISEAGHARLRELSELSQKREVALICQCEKPDRCHCDLLMLLARHCYQAPIYGLKHDYPVFRSRLALIG